MAEVVGNVDAGEERLQAATVGTSTGEERPRRHLLTTGWSAFVNQKKLVAGDSVVFLRGDGGELRVGIRRAKRGFCGAEEGSLPGWDQYAGPVRAEDVFEAARLAGSGQPFEAVYYPRASTPEFYVRAAAVRTAMQVQWCPGIRFKMTFETEDSSLVHGHRRRCPGRRPHPLAAVAVEASSGELGRTGPPPERETGEPVAGRDRVQHAGYPPRLVLAAVQEAADSAGLPGVPIGGSISTSSLDSGRKAPRRRIRTRALLRQELSVS